MRDCHFLFQYYHWRSITVHQYQMFCQEIALNLLTNETDVIFILVGNLGAGKTHFVQNVMQYFSDDLITSPTFSLMNLYHTKTSQKIAHIDCYRLNEQDNVCKYCANYINDNKNTNDIKVQLMQYIKHDINEINNKIDFNTILKNYITFMEWPSCLLLRDWIDNYKCFLLYFTDNDYNDQNAVLIHIFCNKHV